MSDKKKSEEKPKAEKVIKGAEMPESEAKPFQKKNVGTVLDIKRGGFHKERIFTYKESLGELKEMLKEAS